MRWRMTSDNTVKVSLGLRLLDGAAEDSYCHNYPCVVQSWELRSGT